MRKLHLVGLTTDRDGLIFTARKGSKSGGYIVPLDDKVLAAITEARPDGNGAPVEDGPVVEVEPVPKRLRSQSALTPREMQARLRAGRSIDEVAAEAGVDTEWVARFAVPILAEQAQVVELARALVYAKPRLGESSQPLGVSVAMNLADRGVYLPDDVAHAGWSAFQLHDSVWMVRFRYRSRGRSQEAQWEIDVPAGRLVARNRQASDLGYVELGRRRRDPEPEEENGEAAAEPVPRPARPRAKAKPRATAAAKRPGPPTSARARRAPSVPARPAAKAAKAPKARRAAPATKVPTPAKARTTRGAVTAKSTAAAKAAKSTTAVKAAKSTTAVKAAKTRTAAKAVKSTTAAKPSPRRRTAKAAPAPEPGPAPGSGGVRMAVAQVSTARVAASMASADREPWAAAVRRPPGPVSPPGRSAGSESAVGRRPAHRPVAPRIRAEQQRKEPASVPAFEPRPAPPPGTEPPEPLPPRVRKVTVPRQSAPPEGSPTMSLPAPRTQGSRQEPVPNGRPKRRRLRSR